MNTNKKYSLYAIESFDGEPIKSGIVLYDKDEDIPCIDTDNPDVVVEIRLTGDLDNPFEKQLLTRCLSLFGISPTVLDDAELVENTHGVLCEGEADIPFEYNSNDAVFEALTASATEAPKIFKKIGDAARAVGKAIGKTVSSAQRTAAKIDDISTDDATLADKFKQQEQALEHAATTDEVLKSHYTELEAAQYLTRLLLQADENSTGDGFFVCIDSGKGKDRKRTSVEITKDIDMDTALKYLEAEDTATTGENKKKAAQARLVNDVLAKIKAAAKGQTISGYTTSRDLASRFARSLNKEGGAADRLKELNRQKNYTELNRIWKASTDSQRSAILRALLSDDTTGKISPKVRGVLMSLATPPFDTIIWKIIMYHLGNESMQPLTAERITFIVKSATLQKLLGKVGLEGLDFGDDTQIAIILKALSANSTGAVDALHQGDKNIWLPKEQMKPIYDGLLKLEQEKDDTELSNAIAGRKSKKDAKKSGTSEKSSDGTSPSGKDLVQDILSGKIKLSTDQKAALIQGLYGKR